jgi:hypothetical protein
LVVGPLEPLMPRSEPLIEEEDDDGSPDEGMEPPARRKPGRPRTSSKLFIDPHRFMDSPDKAPSVPEARTWVMKHLRSPKGKLKPEMCPNGFAWGMLWKARENEQWFFEKVCQGVKMTRDELETQRKRRSSAHILEQLEKVRAAVVGAGK